MSTLTLRMRTTLLPDSAVSTARMLGFSCLGALATGLLAQVSFYFPGMPVPFTGQVFGVLLVGAMLGRGYGMLSQCLYVGLGLAGVPWFTGAQSGLSYMFGVTGGYLVGFIVSGMFLGAAMDLAPVCRRFAGRLAAMLIACAIIYAFGVYHLVTAVGFSLQKALLFGVAPFAMFDAVKAIAAAAIVGRMRAR